MKMKLWWFSLVVLLPYLTGFTSGTPVEHDEDEVDEEASNRKDPRSFYQVQIVPRVCTSTNNGRQGICLHRLKCRQQGGTRAGTCALGFGSCCLVERTCGQTTRAGVSYFVSTPTTGTASTAAQCTMTVNVRNRNVCQLRLDFDQFSLAQPTPSTTNPLSAPQCIADTFTVTPSPVGLQPLCGENTGQHIYIPVNAASGNVNVNLDVNRLNTGSGSWRIRTTQINCSNNRNTRGQVAPDGCLQYYTAASGSIQSFNYNGGNGPYPPNMNYAMCIERSSTATCALSVTAPTFQLGTLTGATNYGSADCDSDAQTPVNHDYLLIPAGLSSTGTPPTRESLFCGNYLETATVTSPARGPIVLSFNSDNVLGQYADRGFQLNYAQQTNNCP